MKNASMYGNKFPRTAANRSPARRNPDVTHASGFQVSQRSPPKKKQAEKLLLGDEADKKKVNDGLAAFTHFLLGKSELDEGEKLEMIR